MHVSIIVSDLDILHWQLHLHKLLIIKLYFFV